MHAWDAAGYSLAGFRRLTAESAARLEFLGGAIGAAVLFLAGASGVQVLVAAILFLLLLAVEALNTAIEVLTDRISPGWSQEAKHAKDLGSLAVGLLILANLAWVAAVGAELV
ncbi:diacylglycerol kinase [Pseudooceanicola sp. LIPI14-2-Ac024]|uniref:diacylglycerol kinase n=1 Tax=Pseudooceanicola sp. LIPI14-2-Ac024 TaxID=3344875 RepID=UPI0035CF1355